MKKYILLPGVSILLTVFIIELISYIIIHARNYIHYDDYIIAAPGLTSDANMGFVPKKNISSYRYRKFPDGTPIFQYTFKTDQYGRRTVDDNYKYSKTKPHLILFGGSNTWGGGLNDEETLQYFLGKKIPGYNLYNYAVEGYGPQHVLALLEKEDISSQVDSDRGIAVYVLIHHHVLRAIGSTHSFWIFSSPYYNLDENGLHRKGSFESGRPFITGIYKTFLLCKKFSNALKLLNADIPLKVTEKHIRLTAEIITEAKKKYEQKFNGRFYVLMHPLSVSLPNMSLEHFENLIHLLEENGITVLRYPVEIKDSYFISNDTHPTGEFNKILANKLADSILSLN